MKNEKQRGVGDRLKKPASPELVNSAYQFELNDTDILFNGMSSADIAHTLMLIETNLIPEKDGKELLSALIDLENTPVSNLNFDPKFGDTYTNREQHLKKKIAYKAGWLHVGRARRESSTIGYIIAARNRLLDFGEELVLLSFSILDKVEQSIDVLMTDFTYLQHAQPTSLAHYLLTFEYPLLRDLERILECFKRLNNSPAGSGSVNGSRLSLNRERLKELLGFDGLTVHARDAMWRIDMPIELYSVLVSASLNINRLVEELQIWSTSEFSLIELDDAHCRTSVIMPQKKNPYALTYFRGLTGLINGRMAGMASILKAVSGQPDNRIFAYGELPRSYDLLINGVKLISSIISTMKVNKDNMYKSAGENFSSATDLAELIMGKNNLDYSTSHRIVGTCVRILNENNEDQFSLPRLSEAALQNGVKIELSETDLENIIDIEKLVASRKGIGGASKESVEEMISECRNKALSIKKKIKEKKEMLFKAEQRLRKTANNILN